METSESNLLGAKQPVLTLRTTAHSWPENLGGHWHPVTGMGGEGAGTGEGGKGEQTGPGGTEEEDGK